MAAISNNGGFPINCLDSLSGLPGVGTESSLVAPQSGPNVPIITGNGAGDSPSPSCTGF